MIRAVPAKPARASDPSDEPPLCASLIGESMTSDVIFAASSVNWFTGWKCPAAARSQDRRQIPARTARRHIPVRTARPPAGCRDGSEPTAAAEPQPMSG